ncbi:hypothetical protein LWI29_024872 [Acer saccharum]|uniref:RRM domain-containing protein n=1 Tax=Acer saccharum TaxID=4024 RepID=A0AA39RWL6_ACESA|nr:hypothetical protein LWI29_024872 [Acer saccharum]
MKRETERGYSRERRPGSLGCEESQVVINSGTQGREVTESLFLVFIDNLNPWLDSLGLWEFFKLYGKVRDVFLSSKKSLRRRSFGFIRFDMIEEVTKVVKLVDGKLIFEWPIRAKMASFGWNCRRFSVSKQNGGKEIEVFKQIGGKDIAVLSKLSNGDDWHSSYRVDRGGIGTFTEVVKKDRMCDVFERLDETEKAVQSPLLILEEKGSPLVVKRGKEALGRRNGIGQWVCADKTLEKGLDQGKEALGRRNGIGSWVCADKTLAKGLDHWPKLKLVNDKDLKEGKTVIFNFLEGFRDKVVGENLKKVKLTNDKVSHVSTGKLALDVRKDKVGSCLNQINSWKEGCWLNFKNFKKGCYREGFAGPIKSGKSIGRNENRKKWKVRDSSVSVKKHVMKTRYSKVNFKVSWNLEEGITKIIETGVKLGFDFKGKKVKMVDILAVLWKKLMSSGGSRSRFPA